MIIAFCGRLRSGKTELSKICENYGYKRLYFALPLKQLIADLIDVGLEEVNHLKTVEKEYIFSNDKLLYLSEKTEIPINIVNTIMKDRIFHNTRELLQIIGTDLIRGYNSDWHVNQIEKMIQPTENYVIDDLRFPNEKKMVERIGGVCFFVVRPNNLENISNHVSETSIKWQMFDNLIINDATLDKMVFKFDTFMKNGFAQSLLKRANVLNDIHTNESSLRKFLNDTTAFNMYEMLFINKCEFDYDAKYMDLSKLRIQNVEIFNNSIYRVYFANGDVDVVSNPLMIEDLKFYEG